ncbi:uncharacterized protein [Littorina saxatilis]|uniref:Tubulin-specific chaperone cofactor E-like protein n=1 Tax=Littorina saxatilis TaxID=31220 RepID=A0AAN9G9W5_9CAEN
MAGQQSDLSSVPPKTNHLGATKSDTTRPGRSFVEAAWEKFHGEMAADDCLGIYMPKKGPAKITDSGHLILPWRVHLTDCGITVAGRHSDVAGMCCNVTELDLTHNDITSLEEVLHVIRCMPQLTFLNLTKNPLRASTVAMATHNISTTTEDTSGSPPACRCSNVTPSGTSPRASQREAVAHTSLALNNASVTSGQVRTEEVVENGNKVRHNFAADFEDGKTVTITTTTVITTVSTYRQSQEKNGAFESARPNAECAQGRTVTTTTTTTTTTVAASTSIASSNEDLASENLYSSKHNTMREPETDKEHVNKETKTEHSSFCTVNQLVLNDTGIAWKGIACLLRLFPNIEELHLSLNNYTSVDLPPDFVHPSLARLFFNGNPVNDWSHVRSLGLAFPNMKQLFLADTDISSLEDDVEHLAQAFPSLEMLSLNKSLLEGWEEVEQLRLFPTLTDVRVLGIPFLEEQGSSARRKQVVARLPNITKLNGSGVTEEEREDAERAFLRLYMDSEDKPERYFELEKVYGKLDPLANVSLSKYNVDVVMGERREHLEINVEQTVRDLKKSLADFAGLPTAKFVVYYRDVKADREPVKLKFPDKTLVSLRLSDEDEFIIEPKE